MRRELLEMGGGAATTMAGVSLYGHAPRGVLVRLSTTPGRFTTFAINAPAWVYEAAKKLEALGRLRRGWDSYDGLPLNPESKALAVKVLDWLRSEELPTPGVVLGSEGDVHLEWQAKERELEVGLSNGHRVVFVKVYPNGDIEEGERSADLPQQLRGLTCWLMRGEQAPAR